MIVPRWLTAAVSAVSTVTLANPATAVTVFDPAARPALHIKMAAQTRLTYGVHAAPFGLSLSARATDLAAIDALRAYAIGTTASLKPFSVVASYEGASGIGLRGAGAAIGTAFRLLALRAEGAAADVLSAARADAVRAAEAFHVAVAITGVPGRLARGIQRLKLDDGTPVPGTTPTLLPLFGPDGKPLPEPKNNGADRADNSKGALPPGMWIWQDSCSKDQIVGWVLAVATLYDALVDDPAVEPKLLTTLREDARAVGAMLREKHAFVAVDGETYEYDLVIMDADGRPTQHHDLHPLGIDGLWLAPDSEVKNVFNLVMALGIVKGLYHVSGDPEAGTFLYEELLGKRNYHALLPKPGDTAALDYVYVGTQTNFSNVNMMAIALFLNLWFERDDAVAAPMRQFMETRWWAPPGVAQAAGQIDQPYFDAFHAFVTTEGTDVTRADRTAAQLLDATLDPYTDAARENCDAAELAAGSCLAIDGKTTIVLHKELNRGKRPIATKPVPPSLRPPSNFDARSDPFEVNGGGDGLGLNPGADLNAAYWMLRWLPMRTPGAIARSAHARDRTPPPAPDAGNAAEPAPEPVAEPSVVAELAPTAEPVAAEPAVAEPAPVAATTSDSGGCQPSRPRGSALMILALVLLFLRPTLRPLPRATRRPVQWQRHRRVPLC